MGDFVADIMRGRYPDDAEAAITNRAGCAPTWRSRLRRRQTSTRRDHLGEVFTVLPFGNSTVILTLTGAQLEQAFLNGFSPACNPAIATGRFPQVSGLAVTYRCDGTTPVVTGMWKAPDGPGGTLTPIGPTDTVRFVTNDFMFTGGDGYTAFASGTDVLFTGEVLLDVVVDYIRANTPVSPPIRRPPEQGSARMPHRPAVRSDDSTGSSCTLPPGVSRTRGTSRRSPHRPELVALSYRVSAPQVLEVAGRR